MRSSARAKVQASGFGCRGSDITPTEDMGNQVMPKKNAACKSEKILVVDDGKNMQSPSLEFHHVV